MVVIVSNNAGHRYRRFGDPDGFLKPSTSSFKMIPNNEFYYPHWKFKVREDELKSANRIISLI